MTVLFISFPLMPIVKQKALCSHWCISRCMNRTAYTAYSCEDNYGLCRLHLVHLCEIKRGAVCSHSPLFTCDYPCYCHALEYFHMSVLVCTLCTYWMLNYILFCPTASYTFLFSFVYCSFFCFPHLTIYSKVSFSASLQGNDTEDYCLDQ